MKELTALSAKYDVYIGGCGCCGSPFLSETPYDAGDLSWDQEKKCYVYSE